MNIKEALYFFGTQSEIARQLGLTRQYVSKWVVDGEIPIVWQYALENLTSGKLIISDKNKWGFSAIRLKKLQESIKEKIKNEIEHQEKLKIKLNKKLEKFEGVINEKTKKLIEIKEKLEKLEKFKSDLFLNLKSLKDNDYHID